MMKKRISNFKFQISTFILGIFIFIFPVVFFPISVKAATFYLDPPQKTIGPNDVIEVRVKVGVSSGECINAAQVGINFPSDILEFKDFNSGESFLTIWVQKPDQEALERVNREGKIIFSGGIPGGYCGVIPGDPGDSNILGSLIFSPKNPIVFHKAKIDFSSDTEAYINDGEGTRVSINAQGAVIEINEKITTSSDVWAEKIAADKIPPEPFVIEIDNSPRVANGRYFVVFSTVDKQTGVDHYEVLETKAQNLQEKKESAFERFIRQIFRIKEVLPAGWVKADSPYILKDQSLNSVIKVKAVDRAGNERIVEYDNAALQSLKNPRSTNWRPIIAVGGGILVIIFVLVPIIVILKRKAKNKIKLG
ncbi:MAG: hypothetical protein PHE24_02670 [Patescibacteria group bacterium]|nr:hypothetical protein [Patescibacteria group bacterium]